MRYWLGKKLLSKCPPEHMDCLEAQEGVSLMRRYGVDNWPDCEAQYYWWNECGVFAISIPAVDSLSDGIQLEMAMEYDYRFYARQMVEDIIAFIPCTIYAPISNDRISVMNLAHKMGFKVYCKAMSTNDEKLTIYKREGKIKWVA